MDCAVDRNESEARYIRQNERGADKFGKYLRAKTAVGLVKKSKVPVAGRSNPGRPFTNK
jgi:hypothetical protein